MRRVRRAVPASVRELLCSCGSGLPRLGSGRCRSCAARLAAATRRARAADSTDINTRLARIPTGDDR